MVQVGIEKGSKVNYSIDVCPVFDVPRVCPVFESAIHVEYSGTGRKVDSIPG
jgi:hypothetical protein